MRQEHHAAGTGSPLPPGQEGRKRWDWKQGAARAAGTATGGAGERPGRPPGRRPVRLRWWLAALALLWAVWMLNEPSARKIERRIDEAVALATACKGREAQSELIALRETDATPEQLRQLQRTLNDAAAACTRAERAEAWRNARLEVESAMASRSYERARVVLLEFTKRWGENRETRALKARIEARRRAHPRAVDVSAIPAGIGAGGAHV